MQGLIPIFAGHSTAGFIGDERAVLRRSYREGWMGESQVYYICPGSLSACSVSAPIISEARPKISSMEVKKHL